MKIKRATNKDELSKAFKLREKVFVEEQGVNPAIEKDGKDEEAIHFIIKSSKKVIGTCRLRVDGSQGKIERMAVDPDFRRKGLGSKLIDRVIEFSKNEDLEELILHAQIDVVKFYKKKGFKVFSREVIREAGIDHLKMFYSIS